jgi:hypothetical protein
MSNAPVTKLFQCFKQKHVEQETACLFAILLTFGIKKWI